MIVKKSLDTTVYELIIESFYKGQYEPGQKIDPTELAENFHISKTPVIQALKRLNSRRILDVSSGGKYSVIVPTKKMLKELCELRFLYESFAVERLCGKISEKDAEALHSLAEDCKELMKTDNTVAVVKADFALHKMLISLTNNQCMSESYETVLDRYIVAKYVAGYKNEAMEKGINIHLDLINYLKNNEKDQALYWLADHIDFLSEGLFQYHSDIRD